ncbi:hypothetical protein PHMEG_00027689 [Phytophthora megakarya]|uniref:Heat shock protein DnaJ n=1 Tax=Phytophthora megakarya TaxID=4795 RepID=A0A225V6T7_9STRA|nr:hypothetical protein PHMEG_00027689 [Phytophthora megakarya]
MSSTPNANTSKWLGCSSREELETSGIMDKWAQQQQHSSFQSSRRSSIQLCPHCMGHRIEKVMYNSMVLEQNCSECDGEGVVRAQSKNQQSPSNASTKWQFY